MEETHAYAQQYIPTWLDRLQYRLFPHQQPPDLPARPIVNGYARTVVRVHFSLADRLRVLFSSRLIVEMRQQSERELSEIDTSTSVFVLAPWDTYKL